MLNKRIPGCGWGSRIVSGFLLGLGLVACANAIPNGARAGDYSYVGAVYFGGWGSGVMIAPGVVLTAGHVVKGANDSPSTPVFLRGNAPFFELDEVSHTVLHPLYGTESFGRYDIGLVFLGGSVVLEEYAALSAESGLGMRNEVVEIVGYGLDLVRRKTTNRLDGMLTAEDLLYVIDASRPVVESGDSGGGLFIERDGQKLLAGITNWTDGMTGSAFASVSYYRDFIDEHVHGVTWLPVAAVAQPGTALLVGLGLVGLCASRRRALARSSTASSS